MSTVSRPTSSAKDPAAAGGSLTFLSAKQLWRSTAPAAVRTAWKADDQSAAWEAWSDHLTERKAPTASLANGSGKQPTPFAWGLPAEQGRGLQKWLQSEILSSVATDAADRWVAEAADRSADLRFALEAVAWAAEIPRLAKTLRAESWWPLTDTLRRLALEASTAAAPSSADAEATVVEQLLAGELPLVLGRLLPEMDPMHDLASESRNALSSGIERLTDGEGLLTSTLGADAKMPAASLLLACWTRCRALAGKGKPPWSADAQLQYEWLVRQTLRVSDRWGRPAFTPADTTGLCDLLRQAIEVAADPSDRAAASLRLKGFKEDGSFEPPAPSNHSEWSETGVLSAGWRDKAPRIVVAHPGNAMRVEIHAGKHILFGGEWPVEVSVEGKQLAAADDEWDCQCWYTDEDGDYLELALEMTGGARLERQFFLSRNDGVAFVAETLFTEQRDTRAIEITTRLPLGTGMTLAPEKETREAVLLAEGKPVAGLIPLALAEWRDDPRGGELSAENGQILLTRVGDGRNLVSPLWIDFSAVRFDKQRTWRQLAVAEELENVSPDVAVAYRVQAAKEQWFLYRSLDEPGNRTALGQNLSSETMVGRFKTDGTVTEYFEIEADDA